MSKYKNLFAKGSAQNWSEEVFLTKKIKDTVPWIFHRTQWWNKTEFRIEKIFNRKDDKMFIKGKGYENSFNSWIDKKDIVI